MKFLVPGIAALLLTFLLTMLFVPFLWLGYNYGVAEAFGLSRIGLDSSACLGVFVWAVSAIVRIEVTLKT